MSALSRLLFPPRCASCRELLPYRTPLEPCGKGYAVKTALCSRCEAEWRVAESDECGVCASHVRDCLCMPPLMKAARVHALFKLVYYLPGRREAAQNRVVYHVKEEGERYTHAFLAERLSPSVAEGLRMAGIAWEECILTYLPRTPRAVRLCGFDQSKNLCRALSDLLGIPMQTLVRRRFGSNRVQKRLSQEERLKNAKASFRPSRHADCTGKTVLLVDDVVTTGAGLSECARVLYGRGAKRVLCVAIAADDVNRDVGVKGRISRDAHSI